uniref:Uncharacterized protein n=1 Tax=Eutreptiella gymnastica TaxID=73025 RepID=A0A6T2B6E0_9EUGL
MGLVTNLAITFRSQSGVMHSSRSTRAAQRTCECGRRGGRTVRLCHNPHAPDPMAKEKPCPNYSRQGFCPFCIMDVGGLFLGNQRFHFPCCGLGQTMDQGKVM